MKEMINHHHQLQMNLNDLDDMVIEYDFDDMVVEYDFDDMVVE